MNKTLLNFERITFDRQLLLGQACIRNMPIAVSHLLNLIAQGITVDNILDLYPRLEREDVQQALEYAALLVNQRVYPHRN